MRPIPRFVLKSSVEFYKKNGMDEYGAVSYDAKVDVMFVKVENIKQSALKALGEFKDDKLLMFYDYANSYPLGLEFSELDKIVYNGKEYIIRTVNNLEDHHDEVILK